MGDEGGFAPNIQDNREGENKSQIVSGQSDCFRTPFFMLIKQIARLFHLISKFDASSLIIKLKRRYFWLIKLKRWYFLLIKHVSFS